ncbi:MAG: HYR domain-containing protein [Saprospiraceae bacterium]
MFAIKHTLIFALLFLFAAESFATHIVGGGVTYECIGSVGNNRIYRFTMKVYRDCLNGQAPLDDPAHMAIYTGNFQVNSLFDAFDVDLASVQEVTINQPDCIDNLPEICLQEATYTWEVTLPVINQSYLIEYQRCCRTDAITNIENPGGTGATYYVEITPASQQLCNSSPAFSNFPPVVICNNYPLEVDYSATDSDGDQLVYSFCAPFAGGGEFGNGCSSPSPEPPCPPPFDEVIFIAPDYTPEEPMGGDPLIQINAQTGIISGTPHLNGQYVVGVCVQEFRDGVLLSVTRRDFQFNVADCAPQVTALVQYDEVVGVQSYVIKQCGDSKTVTIVNESLPPANIETFEWVFDLGNGNILENSTDFDLTVDFPSFGTYNGILVLNEGLDCGDTAFIQVRLYPPATLDLGADLMICKDSTLVFDAGAGFTAYQWQDGSTAQTFSATTTGLYHVAATDSCGNVLRDSVLVSISPAPEVNLANVSICPGKSVTLNVAGFDQYLWSPAAGLSCTDCPNPTIQAGVNTTYTLTATNQEGCVGQGSFQVTVLPTPMHTYLIQFYPNQSVTLGGQTYTQPGTVMLNVASTTGGCDSLNTYILELIPTTLDLQCPANLTVALPNNATTIVANYALPTATTDCPGSQPIIQLQQGLASGGNFPAGVNTVCYGATNACSNTDACCFTVTVTTLDIQCPANLTVALPNNASTIAVNYALPTATTDCPGSQPAIQLQQGPPSGGNFSSGVNSVCYGATNTCGNNDACCFTVTVTTLDIQCPANLTVALPNNAPTTEVNYALPTTTTNCPGSQPTIQLQQGLASGGNFPAGVNTVCYGATNTCGNGDACCFTVTVTTLDIQCPANQTVQLPVAATTVVVTYNAPTTTTNCPGPVSAPTLVQGLSSGSGFPLGITKVCYEGSNTCGNRDTCCFNVTVLDAPPPCDIKTLGCMRYELLDIRLDAINQRRFRIRATNYCASEVDYIAIQLPPGIVAVTPKEASIYIAPNTDNQYKVRNPNASPFYSVRYRSVSTGLTNGQSDVFEYRLPQQSHTNNYIHITGKLKNGLAYEAHLNTWYCPVQPWEGAKGNAEYGIGNAELGIGNSEFHIRPNPTAGSLFVDIIQWQGQSAQVQVLNAQGQLVLDRRCDLEDEWLELNLDGDLPNGLYYVVVQPVGGAKSAAKFVLER